MVLVHLFEDSKDTDKRSSDLQNILFRLAERQKVFSFTYISDEPDEFFSKWQPTLKEPNSDNMVCQRDCIMVILKRICIR